MKKKKRKIVVHILNIFVSLLLFSIVSISIHSYISSRSAILKLADQLVTHEHQAIIEKLNYSLKPTPFIRISSYLVRDNFLSVTDMKSLSEFMQLMLKLYPEFNSVYLADQHGNMFLESQYSEELAKSGLIRFVEASKVPLHTKFISEILTKKNNSSFLTLRYKDISGKVIKETKNIITNFDARTRPWFKGADSNLDHHWVGIYHYYGASEPGLSLSYAIRDNMKTRAILGADLKIESIENRLKELDTDKNKYVFIVNNIGQLIASTKNMHTPNQSALFPIQNSNNPIVNYAYKLREQSEKSSFMFKLGGIEYKAHFTPFSFNQNSKWEIVSIIPLNFFTLALEQSNKYNLMFSFFILILSLGLVFLFARKISKPIIYLANETKHISDFSFSRETYLVTHIYEIELLLNAINKTKAALNSFAKYVPKILVEQLLRSKKIAQVGGEKKTITLLFTDISNFTQLSEKIDPHYLMIHLSEYLNILTKLIHQHNGNIDKYIGDAIMAFWGAPLENKYHIENACEATLACSYQLKKINRQWSLEGKPSLNTRFGLASGQVVIGNVGSTDRLNYTAIGDSVNLAARLEALNKLYGSEIIVTDVIYQHCKDKFLFRPLDTVLVRGKSEILLIYELLASKHNNSDCLATPLQIELCQLSSDAYEAFHTKNIKVALELFYKIHEKFPMDGMSVLYIKRCQELLGPV